MLIGTHLVPCFFSVLQLYNPVHSHGLSSSENTLKKIVRFVIDLSMRKLANHLVSDPVGSASLNSVFRTKKKVRLNVVLKYYYFADALHLADAN